VIENSVKAKSDALLKEIIVPTADSAYTVHPEAAVHLEFLRKGFV
jgi:hypothetical protein